MTLSTSAFCVTNCDSEVTSEIEACAQKNFESADKDLNREYGELLNKLSPSDKYSLLIAQRDWIAYKTKYCQAAFDATSPGAEAGVDKLSCLEATTSTRTRELRYIDSSYDMRDFSQALKFMAVVYENGNQDKVISKLITATPDGSNPDWKKYVEASCQLTHTRLREENNVCAARMNFYKNW